MAFRAHGITGDCKPATKEGKKILRTILVKKQHPLADKKGRQQQQQQQHFDKAPEKLQVAEKDAQHAQVIAKLCAAQKRKYQPWHLANAEIQPSATEIAVAGETNNDSGADDHQEPSEEEFEDVFGHQHHDDQPPCSGAASSSGPYVPTGGSPNEVSVTDTQRLSIGENKARALAKQASRKAEGKVSSAQRSVISDNKEKAVAKKRARANQPVWDIVEHTVDLFSLPTAGSTSAEAFVRDRKVEKAPPAEPALPTPAEKESSPSVRPCKYKPKTAPSKLLLMQLPPVGPLFIAEAVQSPPVQVATLSEEFVPPAALDVDEELAELNGCAFRQPVTQRCAAVEQGSRDLEVLVPEEPPGGFDLGVLADLLDMHDDRLPVCWPPGLDALTARAVLLRAKGQV